MMHGITTSRRERSQYWVLAIVAALLTALNVQFSDLTAEQLTPILLYHVVGAKVGDVDHPFAKDQVGRLFQVEAALEAVPEWVKQQLNG